MHYTDILILVKLLFITKTVTTNEVHYDDIMLTSNQSILMRAGLELQKTLWPVIDGLPTIHYAVHESLQSSVMAIREMMDVVESGSCVRFVPISISSPIHKLLLLTGKGCMSYIGLIQWEKSYQEIYLGEGCLVSGKGIHELLHAVGLEHTHQRIDRDEYIMVRYENIQREKTAQFTKTWASTSPYNYDSIMHYGSTFFSANGLTTIVTKDVTKQSVIGTPTAPHFGDFVLINELYQCSDKLFHKCGPKTCQNDGFLNVRCSCVCPPTYTGQFCEFKNAMNVNLGPKCGGRITSPRIITTPGWPDKSELSNCLWEIEAPKCHSVQLTILKRGFHTTNMCQYNMLEIRHASTLNGTAYCSNNALPENFQINSIGQDMVLYYVSRMKNFINIGVEMKIEFKRKTCNDLIPCQLKKISKDLHIYSTVEYPNGYQKHAKCHHQFMNKTGYFRLDIVTQLTMGDYLYIIDRYRSTLITGGSKRYVHIMEPASIWFSSESGNKTGGFEISVEEFHPPTPCSSMVSLSSGTRLTFQNPLTEAMYPRGGLCRMLLKAHLSDLMQLEFKKLENFEREENYMRMIRGPFGKTCEDQQSCLEKDMEIIEIVFVQDSTLFSDWTFSVAVDKYY